MTCGYDLGAGHWAFPGVPRSALLCLFFKVRQVKLSLAMSHCYRMQRFNKVSINGR
jgi:hypothetical protein